MCKSIKVVINWLAPGAHRAVLKRFIGFKRTLGENNKRPIAVPWQLGLHGRKVIAPAWWRSAKLSSSLFHASNDWNLMVHQIFQPIRSSRQCPKRQQERRERLHEHMGSRENHCSDKNIFGALRVQSGRQDITLKEPMPLSSYDVSHTCRNRLHRQTDAP